MTQQVTKSIENLQIDEWTEAKIYHAGGQVAFRVNVECTDRVDDATGAEDFGWYSASILSGNGVHYTSMTAGPIAPADFEAVLDVWTARSIDYING